MRVYLGGSAAELERCRHWHERLVSAGVTVTSTWIASVTAVGCSNPRDASAVQRRGWAVTDIDELLRADLLWMLVPSVTAPTRGAWVESGVAYFAGKPVVFSGDTAQSIFCALGAEFADDEAAFSEVLHLARRESVPA